MKLLFVNGCISQRGEESRTLVLASSFLDAWQATRGPAGAEALCAGDAERPGRPGGDPVLRCAGV